MMNISIFFDVHDPLLDMGFRLFVCFGRVGAFFCIEYGLGVEYLINLMHFLIDMCNCKCYFLFLNLISNLSHCF